MITADTVLVISTILHFLQMSDGTHNSNAYAPNMYFEETDKPRTFETEVNLLFPNLALIFMRAAGHHLVRLVNWRTGETFAVSKRGIWF